MGKKPARVYSSVEHIPTIMGSSRTDTEPDPERFRELMLTDGPNFEDLLECVFGITEPVAEVYRHLVEQDGHTAEELAQTLDCEKSSVNRKLNSLQELGLVTRRRDLLKTGGFAYRYESVPLEEAQGLMHETLDEWSAFMHQQIDEVDDASGPLTQD